MRSQRSKAVTLREVAELVAKVARISSRKEKVRLLAAALSRMPPEDAEIAARFMCGRIFPPSSDLELNVGPSTIYRVLREVRGGQQLLVASGSSSLREVYEILERIAKVRGEGSRRRKERLLTSLFSRLSDLEADFLLRAIFGEVRMGASEGVMLEALASVAGVTLDEMRRAYMFLGDVGELARIAVGGGASGVRSVKLTLFRPVKPMLADMAYDVREVLKEHGGTTALEYKYDGVRVQIHVKGDKVKVFTRRLTDITQSVPDVVEAVKEHVRAREAILDGEALGVVNGRPVPFQEIVRRVRRQRELKDFLRRVPLKLFLFDLLYLNGRVLIDEPYSERWKLLEEVAEAELLAKRRVVSSRLEAEDFLKSALEEGHEGVIGKMLNSSYEPGRRGRKWLKVKPADTVDCVIVAAEWGHGRRAGWLSDYYLAVRDEETGEFMVVGKTFKGLTDEEFEEMTKRLLELKVKEEGYVVYVVPRIVVEVAYNEIQRSPKYRSGLALRFARIVRIRWDKSPDEITTLQELKERYLRQFRHKVLPENEA